VNSRTKTVRFIFVGGVGAVLETSIFILMFDRGVQLYLSNIIAFHIAFFVCYFLHLNYTHSKPFSTRNAVLAGFVKYSLLMYFQLFIGTALLSALIESLGINPLIAKLFQIGIVTPLGYLVQSIYIFRSGIHK
jgi:putative flippase GtrA